MKKIIFILSITFFSIQTFSQSMTATTADGKKVLLKNDKTWEYLKEVPNKKSCVVDSNFKEPKSNNSSTWKRMGATVSDMKKHVSVDLGVNEKEIILIELSEQMGNAIYVLCINGESYKYRRTGTVFFKDGAEPYTPR
jgi:hypothetical protein